MLVKIWGIILLAIWLLVTLSAFILASSLGNRITHLQIIQILTGNFFIDAFIAVIVIAPYIVPLAIVIGFSTKKLIQMRFIDGFMISLASVCSILSLISLISQLTVPLLPFFLNDTFQYIGLSLGTSFWAAIFSIFSYHRTSNFILKNILSFGICSPIILVPIIPWSLELHGLSWAHLYD